MPGQGLVKNQKFLRLFYSPIELFTDTSVRTRNLEKATMEADFVLAGIVAVGLLCYLVYAMFNAEKF
jgi:K+-transporting ATPase KdpF subunit